MFTDKSSKKYLLIISLILVYFLVLSAFWIMRADSPVGEGTSMYKGKAVYDSITTNIKPFSTKSKVMPYIYGIPLKLIGYSLTKGRFISSLFILLALLFLGLALWQTDKRAAVIGVALIALDPFTIKSLVTNIESSTVIFIMSLSIFLLTRKDIMLIPSTAFNGRFSSFKQTISFLAFLFVSSFIWTTTYIVAIGLILVLFFLIMKYTTRRLVPLTIAFFAALSFVPLLTMFYEHSVLFTLLLVATGYLLFANTTIDDRNTSVLSPINENLSINYAIVSSVFILAFSVYPPKVFSQYGLAVILPISALVIGLAFGKLLKSNRQGSSRVALISILIVLLFVSPAISDKKVPDTFRKTRLIPPAYSFTKLGSFVKKRTSEDDKIATFSPIVAFYAKRNLPPEFQAGAIKYKLGPQRGRLIYRNQILTYIKNKQVSAVILTDKYYENRVGPKDKNLIKSALKKNGYRLIIQYDFTSGLAIDKYGWGNYDTINKAKVYLLKKNKHLNIKLIH